MDKISPTNKPPIKEVDDENWDDFAYKFKISECIEQFAKTTTSHAFKNLLTSKSATVRHFWTVASLMGAAFFCVFVADAGFYNDVISRGTRVSRVFERVSTLPTIVICDEKLIESEPFMELFTSLNASKPSEKFNLIKQVVSGKTFVKVGGQVFSLSKYTLQLKQSLVMCKINNITRKDEWETFWSKIHGVCFAFNDSRNGSLLDDGRLHVELRSSSVDGLNLFVSDASEYVFSSNSIQLHRDVFNMIRLRKTVYKRKENCSKKFDQSINLGYAITDVYNEKLCHLIDFSELIAGNCSCKSSLPHGEKFSHLSLCMDNLTRLNCENHIRNSAHVTYIPECKAACQEVVYSREVNTYPRQQQQKHVVSLNVDFGDSAYTMYEENTNKQSLSAIFGHFGGLLVLLTGCSLFSLVEICLFLVRLMRKLKVWRRTKKREKRVMKEVEIRKSFAEVSASCIV